MVDLNTNVFDFTTGEKIVRLEGSKGDVYTTIPKTRKDYLKILKSSLEREDYCDVLLGIMDTEIYGHIDDQLQKIVDCYYNEFTA